MKNYIPAQPSTFMIFKDKNELILGELVIAWCIEVNDVQTYCSPIGAFDSHEASNLWGVLQPNGHVVTQESRWPTFAAAKAEVAKDPDTI